MRTHHERIADAIIALEKLPVSPTDKWQVALIQADLALVGLQLACRTESQSEPVDLPPFPGDRAAITPLPGNRLVAAVSVCDPLADDADYRAGLTD